MRYVTGLYIDPDTVMETTVPDELHSYYKLLGCDCIEAPSLRLHGRYYDIVCDEEALCKNNVPLCSVCVCDAAGVNPVIMGPCFVVKADEEGDWCSLSSEELIELKGAVVTALSGNPPKPHNVLVMEGYRWMSSIRM